MATATMVLRSIPKSDEPEAKAMYRNLRNLVERATMQQVEVDWRQHTITESHDTHDLVLEQGVQASQSTWMHVHIKHRMGGIRDAQHILDNRRWEQKEVNQPHKRRCARRPSSLGVGPRAFGHEI
jgi:hypothetical protein